METGGSNLSFGRLFCQNSQKQIWKQILEPFFDTISYRFKDHGMAFGKKKEKAAYVYTELPSKSF
jgi:hypothetical protein